MKLLGIVCILFLLCSACLADDLMFLQTITTKPLGFLTSMLQSQILSFTGETLSSE